MIRDLYITFLLWILWLLLLYPLASILIWRFFGVNIAYGLSSERADAAFQTLSDFILVNGSIVLALIITYGLWSLYNDMRYSGNKNRRKNRPIDPLPFFVAKTSHKSSELLLLNQNLRYLQVDHVDKHSISDLKSHATLDQTIIDQGIKAKTILFNDDWEQVRKSSDFGYEYSRKVGKTCLLKSQHADDEHSDIPTALFNINQKENS